MDLHNSEGSFVPQDVDFLPHVVLYQTYSPLLRERSGTTPSKSDRLRLLSPAARKLIERKATSSDKALNASYSPQLSSVYSRVKTPSTTTFKSTPVNHTPSLTDDLLDIVNTNKSS